MSTAPDVCFIDEDWPTPRVLRRLVVALLGLGYDDPEIDRIVSYAHVYGSLSCCPFVAPHHRDMLEEALPLDPEWDSPRWDELAYAPGPEATR